MRNDWKIMLFMMIYGASCVYMMLEEGDFLYLMLIWNVILSTVPLFMIRQAAKKENLWTRRIYIILWILFLPNAFYMMTDFIHITHHPMIWIISVEPYSGLRGTEYTQDVHLWLRLLIISLGAFYALVAALQSSEVFLDMVDMKRRTWARLAYIFLISLLSSVGIYMGRFLRFNSWDVLHPLKLMRTLIQSVDDFSYIFILVYTIFILSTFLIGSLFLCQDPVSGNHLKSSGKVKST